MTADTRRARGVGGVADIITDSATNRPSRSRWRWRSPKGYVSRPDFASGDWFAGTAENYQSEATSYIAYSGPFHVDETKQTLTHSMFVSLFPDWTGQTQPREVRLDGDTLHLGTASPIQSSGKTVNSVLTWRRAEPN